MASARRIAFGLFLPQWNERAGPDTWRRIARAAEENGFDAVSRGDHVAYPSDPNDENWTDSSMNAYDVFSVLSYVAGITDELTLGTNICVAPLRHPVHLAKLALSLDALSAGRFEFGVAVGWLRREFAVLDVPFDERGSRTDEFLDLFATACEEPEFAFEGPHHSFDTTGFHPRPAGDGGPPIMIGGNSGAAFRRLAEFGDGWLISASPDEVSSARRRIMAAWKDYDRDGEPAIAAGSDAYVGSTLPPNVEGPLVGTADEIIETIDAYADAGTTRVDLRFYSTTADVEESVAQIRRFGEEILPSF